MLFFAPVSSLKVRLEMLKSGAKDGFIKVFIGWMVVFAVRLIPFRPPNVEPVLATLMPFSKRYGAVGGFLFAFLSIVLFDIATGHMDVLSIITGIAYGCVGLASALYFSRHASTAKEFLKFSIIGTLLFDAVTGPGIAYFLNHPLPFREALVGQIPFTLLHLLGNGILALTLSPVLHRWVVTNPKLEVPALLNRFAFSKR